MPPPSAGLPARSKFIYNRASMNRPSQIAPPQNSGKPSRQAYPLPAFESGTVWIAGAGPGAAEHLTLGALAALREAEVIVYDALVSAEVLKLARRGAVLEYAGKRGGKPSPKQADITERLIHHARNGVKVLRLKGVDPFVFGRGWRRNRWAYPRFCAFPYSARDYRRHRSFISSRNSPNPSRCQSMRLARHRTRRKRRCTQWR